MIANVAAATFGALLKLYDDMEDNPVIARYSSSQIMEIIKALIIASLTYASMHNMNFPFIIFIANYIHYLITDDNALSTDFYHAGMIISLLLSIITFDLSTWNMTVFIVVFVSCTLGAYMDHNVFSEEYSWKKIIARTIYSIFLLVILQFSSCIPYYDIILLHLGYCIMSVLLMTCAQWSETSSKEPKEPNEPKESKEPKEPKEPSKETPQDESEKEIHIQVK